MPKDGQQQTVRRIPDSVRRIVADGIEQADLWGIIRSCKTNRDFQMLFYSNTAKYETLKRYCAHDLDRLRKFSAGMFALGAIRGMQFGRHLDSITSSTVVQVFLKHASIRTLLLKTPRSSAIEICRALDKLDQPMPGGGAWRDLKRKNSLWSECTKNPLVKVAITNARKAAMQAAEYEEMLAVVDGVGEAGSVFSRFNYVRNGLRKAKI